MAEGDKQAITISTWKNGLDGRRSQLTSNPQTLLTLNNAHINQGAEIEKRKALVRQLQPTSTFGCQPSPTTIWVFGSSTDPGVSSPFTYQQLTAPSGASMTSVICSTLFGNEPFVVAQFSDGQIYAFYNGSLVEDFIAGQVNIFPTLVGIAQGLAALVNATSQYTAIYNNGSVGVDTFDVFSIPNTTNGNPYTEVVTLSSASGTLSASNISSGSAATAAGIATGAFQILAGANDVKGVFTLSGTPSDGDTVTIGATTYTFKTALGPSANQVLIGGSAANAIANLSMAIMATGTLNTTYGAVTANASASSTAGNASNAITVNAIVGTTVAVSKSGTNLAWSGLSGGATGNLTAATANYVSSIKVGAQELLSSNVAFAKDLTTTITNVVSNITANSGSSGFTASASGNVITLSTTSGTSTYNGAVIKVTAHGFFFCDNCVFTITGTTFTLDYVKVTSVDILGTVLTFPTNNEQLAYFAQRAVQTINAAAVSVSGTTYSALALPGTAAIYVSALTTQTTDPLLSVAVSVTGTASGGGGGTNPLTVTQSSLTTTLQTSGHLSGFVLSNGQNYWILFEPITIIPSGGVPPYTYTYTVSSTVDYIFTGTGGQVIPVTMTTAQGFMVDSSYVPTQGGFPPTPLATNSSSAAASLFVYVSSAPFAPAPNAWSNVPYSGTKSLKVTFSFSVTVTDSTSATGTAGPIVATAYTLTT